MFTQGTQLSSWHLCSDRSYTLTALLFPYEKSIPHLEAITHIKTALQRLAKHRPDFTGSLILGPFGKSIYLYQSGNNEIPFVVGDPLEDQDTSYGRLQAQGFPLRAFTQPGLKTAARLSEWATKPVIHVQMTFLDGGLLLVILLHKSFADSDGMRMILECFAACTRGETPPEYPQDGDIDPFEFRANALEQHWKGRKKTFDELLKQTPEFSHHPAQAEPMGFYTRVTSNMPPQTIPQISVTLVFPKRRLEILKENVTRHLISSVEPLSTFAVLAGLTWAHVTRAQKQSCPQAWAADPDGLAQLFMAVSWRSRVTATQAVKQYFGPAVVTPVVRDGCDRVLAACQEKTGRTIWSLKSIIASRASTTSSSPRAAPCGGPRWTARARAPTPWGWTTNRGTRGT